LPTYFSALSNDSSQDVRTQESPVEMFKEDLHMFEESVQAAETHESLSAFKTLRIPLVSYDLISVLFEYVEYGVGVWCIYLWCVYVCMCVCVCVV